MPTITLQLPVAVTEITAGLHASNYNALQTLLNGGLDATNLATGAVTAIKIPDLEITGAKIANSTITIAKISATGTPSATTFLRGDGTWATPGSSSITTVEASLGADVSLTVANTYYDGPSVVLSAGTWLITGTVTVVRGGVVTGVTAKLWDGTTVESSACGSISAADEPVALSVSGIVVIAAGTPTWKISVAATAAGPAGNIKAAAPYNGAGNNASHIKAIKVA